MKNEKFIVWEGANCLGQVEVWAWSVRAYEVEVLNNNSDYAVISLCPLKLNIRTSTLSTECHELVFKNCNIL